MNTKHKRDGAISETMWRTGLKSSLCDVCGAHGDLVCGSCQARRYCSLNCQKEDWKKHKLNCKRVDAKQYEICADDTIRAFDHDIGGELRILMDNANKLQANFTKENAHKAIKMYEEACNGWQRQKDLLGAAKCLLNIANTYRQLDKIVDAKKYAVMAKDMYENSRATELPKQAQKFADEWASALAWGYSQIIAQYYQNKIRVTIESNLNVSEDVDGNLYKITINPNIDQLWEEEDLYQRFLFKHNCCANCREGLELEKRKKCARCHNVIYCSKACQTQHWKMHKKHCNNEEMVDMVRRMNQTHTLWKKRFEDCVADYAREASNMVVVKTEKL